MCFALALLLTAVVANRFIPGGAPARPEVETVDAETAVVTAEA